MNDFNIVLLSLGSIGIFLFFGIFLFRAYVWDKYWPKLQWKFGSTDTRYRVLIKTAKEYPFGFPVIADKETVNSIIDSTEKYDPNPKNYKPALHHNEYLFAGDRMHNYLVVGFCHHTLSLFDLHWVKNRVKELVKRYPRLRMVYIVDCKESPQNIVRRVIDKTDANVFFLKDYLTPESIIRNLTKIRTNPVLSIHKGSED